MSGSYRRMVLDAPGTPLRPERVPGFAPGPGQVVLDVRACGICRTDLHVLDGDLPHRGHPVVPGHQVVGVVADVGAGVDGLAPGLRVGVPWLATTCGRCDACLRGEENLCDAARFTGYDVDGGFADRMVAAATSCYPLPHGYDDLQVAPLLCAGLIGYRALRMAGDARRLGLYGFGAAAHIIAQVAVHQGRDVFAFTRPGDTSGQAFARELGVVWAGDSTERPERDLDAAILFAPVGDLVPTSLAAVRKGGVVVCAGIHMSDIPSFPYALLWGERIVRSVANLTRRDGEEFLALAPQIPVRTHVTTYPLEDAGRALDDLRHGRFRGAAVLDVSGSR